MEDLYDRTWYKEHLLDTDEIIVNESDLSHLVTYLDNVLDREKYYSEVITSERLEDLRGALRDILVGARRSLP